MIIYRAKMLPTFATKQKKKFKKFIPKKKDYLRAGLEPKKYYYDYDWKPHYLANKESYIAHAMKRYYRLKDTKKYRKRSVLYVQRKYFEKKNLYKTCIKCHKTKTLADFDYRRAPRTVTARHSMCKQCRAEHNHKKYLERKAKGMYNKNGLYNKDANK